MQNEIQIKVWGPNMKLKHQNKLTFIGLARWKYLVEKLNSDFIRKTLLSLKHY